MAKLLTILEREWYNGTHPGFKPVSINNEAPRAKARCLLNEILERPYLICALKSAVFRPQKYKLPCLMDKREFRRHNEELSRRFDIDRYLENSHFLIRLIERKRFQSIVKILNSNKGGVLLDVGCGNGFLLNKLRARIAFGIELSFYNITKARARIKNASYCFLQADAEFLPFAHDRFDAVVCTEVIEHVQNHEAVLKEIRRVLKPQGLFVITLPNDLLISKLKKIFKRLYPKGFLSFQYGGGQEWHAHIFSKEQIKQLLTSSGFRIEGEKKIPFSFLPIRYIFQCRKDG